jgi:long-chain fatty acid transport protein
VSVGFGINFQRAEATLTNSVNYSAAAGGLLGAGLEGVATVKGHDDMWGYNVGIMYDFTPNTRVGASYRSSMDYTIKGDVVFANRPAALAGAIPNGSVSAEVKLPAQATVALFHKLNPQWDILADVSWTGWDSIQTLDIMRTSGPGGRLSTTPLNWKDTWRVGLGANWHYNNQWTFRFGVAYDQSPVPDADRTPRVPDQDRTWLAIGAQFRMTKQLAIDVGYSHIFVKDASVNLCNAAQAAANPAACAGKNNLVGNYGDNKVDIISAQARYQF